MTTNLVFVRITLPKLPLFNLTDEIRKNNESSTFTLFGTLTCFQVEEEQTLVNELKKIELRKKERDKKTQDLQKLITAADSEARKQDKKNPKKKIPVQKSTKTDGVIDMAGIKFADFKSSGVSLRSQRVNVIKLLLEISLGSLYN